MTEQEKASALKDIRYLTNQLGQYAEVINRLKLHQTVHFIDFLGSSDYPSTTVTYQSLASEVEKLKTAFARFREINAEFYAETYSNKCDIQ
jgi:hypothetical protein